MPGAGTLLLFDVAWGALLAVVVVPPLIGVGWLHRWLESLIPLWATPALWLVDYALLCVGICLMVWLLRAPMGRMKPGKYPYPAHSQTRVWLLSFALGRVLYLPLWKNFMFAFASLRYLFLKALGANVSFQMQTASDVQVLDAGLHSIGKNSMLAAGVMLSGHMVQDGTLRLGSIVLGDGVNVLMGAEIGPDVVVGDNSVIGPHCRLGLNVRMGAEVYVGMACTLGGGVTLGDHVVVGHDVTLEPGVVLEEGAVVAPHTLVPRGTKVGAGERYPPRKSQIEKGEVSK